MRPRTFQFQLGGGQGRGRGLPGVLVLVVGAVVVAGVVALVIFLGTIVAALGLVASAGAALYFGARRLLAKGKAGKLPAVDRMQSRPVTQSSMGVKEIEVEVVPEDRK